MRIENYKSDMPIDKAVIDNGQTRILVDKDILTGDSLTKYTAFTERFGDKKYIFENMNGVEIIRFTNEEVSDLTETLDFNSMSAEDLAIIDAFLTITAIVL